MLPVALPCIDKHSHAVKDRAKESECESEDFLAQPSSLPGDKI